MRSVIVIFLFACTEQARAKKPVVNRTGNAHDSMDELADEVVHELCDRALKTLFLHHADLDLTTSGKPSHLVNPACHLSSQSVFPRPALHISCPPLPFSLGRGFVRASSVIVNVLPEQTVAQPQKLFKSHAHFEHVPRGVLGPPAHFEPLLVGTQFLSASRECSMSGNQLNIEVVRLASRPAIFHAGGLVSEAECDYITAAADAAGSVPNPGNVRSGCSAAALSVESDEVLAAIGATCEELFLQPEALEPSDWSTGIGIEDMAVIKYADGGECRLHHDCTEGKHRVITVIIYLNDVGETWFPLALKDSVDAEQVASANPPFHHAMAAALGLPLGTGGVVAAPKKGDAIIFYNYFNDGSGELDGLAVHAGLPASGKKSIATLFYSANQKRNEE